MDFLDLLRAMFALAITLGIIGLAAWGARRYAPQLLARLSAERGERRMKVVETLMLDPARRLVLVRIDDEERLLILGEGRELIEPRGAVTPSGAAQ
ncbi:FliO/MopB family protein [Brevundimonas sp. TWP2-3-4b2]|uniref:FliO/MopB family protein n=1 Tax=Brevundimonas sp. TWP2-3-4b2 TaxID=2804595 RepID=UPI003CED2297